MELPQVHGIHILSSTRLALVMSKILRSLSIVQLLASKSYDYTKDTLLFLQ